MVAWRDETETALSFSGMIQNHIAFLSQNICGILNMNIMIIIAKGYGAM